MNVDFYGYFEPNCSDTCVAICFFRPLEYENPLSNMKIFLEDLRGSNIPVFSIELLYEGQKTSVPDPNLVVKSGSVLFSKENLWNILENSIPDQYSKIIFLDSDIRFSDHGWFDKCSVLLDSNDVIQPMEHCYRDIFHYSNSYEIDEAKLRPSMAKGIAESHQIDVSWHYPGFGVGIRRDFFKNIGGFFDHGLNGYGDTLFWGAFGEFSEQYIQFASNNFKHYPKYCDNIAKLAPHSIYYLTGNIAMHFYHGSTRNRRYSDRNKYLPDQYELFYNECGVLEIRSDKNLVQYWIDRKEDS